MNRSLYKLAKRLVCLPLSASVAIGLCLFAGQGLRVLGSGVDFLAANSSYQIATSSPIEAGVTSLEKQVRPHSKPPRRTASFGALPPCRALELPAVFRGRSISEARCETLISRSLPNDRAPPSDY